MDRIYDTVIIGGGPAGYTAALYAARAGLSTLVLEKLSAGGQMALTSQVDNYPGFPEGVDGFTLGDAMQQGAERFGARTELAEVRALKLREDTKCIETSEGTFYGKTVILATGAVARKLGLPEEERLTGKGVNYCAHCDGHFYKGKTVAVIGGGNSAVADALLLSRLAEQVILIHRRDTLRADKVYDAPLRAASNIRFLWNSTVTKLLHGDRLDGITVRDTVSGTEQNLAVDGIFISVGREPVTELVRFQLELDRGGYVVADETTRTSLPGVYAAGDLRTKRLRQIVTAVADGAAAAHEAEQYLAEHKQ